MNQPSLFARLGCALIVTASLMVIFSLAPIWYISAVAISVDGDVPRMVDILRAPSVQTVATIYIMVVIGLMLSMPAIAIIEAGHFMTWIKR